MHNDHALNIVKNSEKHHQQISVGPMAQSHDYKSFLVSLKAIDKQYAEN